MELRSKLSSDDYRKELHANLSSFTDFVLERFTGIVIGSFFMITHHAAYEWNRKITSEKHNTVGIVLAENSSKR